MSQISKNQLFSAAGTALGGEAVFTNVGTHSWVVPDDVESVCVVCIGGGSGGSRSGGSGSDGGGAGGLGWINDYAVVPGDTYTVVVGYGGTGASTTDATNGGPSYFVNNNTVAGFASPSTASSYIGGSYFGDGGGDGGTAQAGSAAGGAGAGGYTGNGGADTSAGSGGGGGGGDEYPNSVPQGHDSGGGGGGTGLYGEGLSGAAGTPSTNDNNGKGGSGGGDGALGTLVNPRGGDGGLYGGGGGPGGYDNSGTLISYTGGNGGQGAVRIIWGNGRAFPSTKTEEKYSEVVYLNHALQPGTAAIAENVRQAFNTTGPSTDTERVIDANPGDLIIDQTAWFTHFSASPNVLKASSMPSLSDQPTELRTDDPTSGTKAWLTSYYKYSDVNVGTETWRWNQAITNQRNRRFTLTVPGAEYVTFTYLIRNGTTGWTPPSVAGLQAGDKVAITQVHLDQSSQLFDTTQTDPNLEMYESFTVTTYSTGYVLPMINAVAVVPSNGTYQLPTFSYAGDYATDNFNIMLHGVVFRAV